MKRFFMILVTSVGLLGCNDKNTPALNSSQPTKPSISKTDSVVAQGTNLILPTSFDYELPPTTYKKVDIVKKDPELFFGTIQEDFATNTVFIDQVTFTSHHNYLPIRSPLFLPSDEKELISSLCERLGYGPFVKSHFQFSCMTNDLMLNKDGDFVWSFDLIPSYSSLYEKCDEGNLLAVLRNFTCSLK